MNFSITDILDLKAIRVPLIANDRRGALEELVDALASIGVVTDPDVFKKSVWEREQQRSTGIGEGLAIPHGKCTSILRPTIAIGRPSVPIEFGAIDRKPVRLIVLLASPPDKITEHIQVLHRVSRIFSNIATRERVCMAPDAATLYEELRSADSSLVER
ncbi:MAG: PTS sugar transporter subunit IIA [Planctomycetota bacterium]|nr:PTS sugar transporter subunit IIA [Planctomycetota bacterium]MDA1261538.1 PTS sugar transporter subunit IIA [Planctomycetota bacterium]